MSNDHAAEVQAESVPVAVQAEPDPTIVEEPSPSREETLEADVRRLTSLSAVLISMVERCAREVNRGAGKDIVADLEGTLVEYGWERKRKPAK